MINSKRLWLVIVIMAALTTALTIANGGTTTGCEDIRATCFKNYEDNTQACYRGQNGNDVKGCINRANQQYEYCVISTGCPLYP